MTTDLVLAVVVGAAIAGFVQGLSGFGFGLTAMSLWAWTLEPRLAAVLSVFGGLTGQVVAAIRLRRRWAWPLLLPFLLGGVAGLPLGVYVLPRLDVPLFKTLLGAMLLVVCPLMLLAPRLPAVRRGGRLGDALAGAAGGVMGGLGGFTGVAPALWCTLRGFAKDEQRAVIQNFNLAMLAMTFAGYLGTGLVEARMLPLLALVAPAMLVPALLGARVYLGIGETAFRQVILGLLFASGVALLVSSLPLVLQRA
jgi:uncharacterized membrane protein YfcA